MITGKTGFYFYPLQIEKAYSMLLTRYVNRLIKEIKPVILALTRKYATQDDIQADLMFSQEFNKFRYSASEIKGRQPVSPNAFVNDVNRWTKKQHQQVLKNAFGISKVEYSATIDKALLAAIKENTDLISSLSPGLVDRIQRELIKQVKEGTRNEVIEKIIEKSGEVTKSRARLIARDQTGKLSGELTKQRQIEAGGNLYQWRTTGDEIVRPTHAVLNGKICTWGDDTVYADTVAEAMRGQWKKRTDLPGYVGIPGQDFQCRCTAALVIDDIFQKYNISTVGINITPTFTPQAPVLLSPVISVITKQAATIPVVEAVEVKQPYEEYFTSIPKSKEVKLTLNTAAKFIKEIVNGEKSKELLPIIKVSMRSWKSGKFGEYVYMSHDRGKGYINLLSAAKGTEKQLLTTIHEYGHHIETSLFGSGVLIDKYPALKKAFLDSKFITNVNKTLSEARVLKLTKDQIKYQNYLKSNQEMFARAFTQYTFERTGLQMEYNNGWAKEDFKSIYVELEKVLKVEGIIK